MRTESRERFQLFVLPGEFAFGPIERGDDVRREDVDEPIGESTIREYSR
ncbi:MAG: hypothetical protein V5A27_10300 [Halapricum sp.]